MSEAPAAHRAARRSAIRRSAITRFALRAALWLLLGSWVGAWALFGAVIAPTAFRVLPSTELAGLLVGPVLETLHLSGAVAGIALAALARAFGRSALLVALPLGMSAVCLYSHFGLSIEMDEIRDLAFGPEGNAELARRFSDLHRLSVRLFLGIGAAAVALLGLHAWAETRSEAA